MTHCENTAPDGAYANAGGMAPTPRPVPSTLLPNALFDIVLPLLSGPEGACLLHIVRRGRHEYAPGTANFFFEDQFAGEDTLAWLGPVRSRPTALKALRALEELDLVTVRSACTHCYWEQQDDATRPSGCPRCGAMATRCFKLAELTVGRLLRLLATRDPQGRTWDYNEVRRRFVTRAPATATV